MIAHRTKDIPAGGSMMSKKIGSFVVACSVLILSVAASHAETAGKVVYAYGNAQLVDGAGAGRDVRRGDEVAAGQTLVTREGRMQVRFADGGFIAVQPNTQFKVDEYHYAGVEDGSEKSFFNLVKGGIRFITGAIGHTNTRNFQIKTTVATIGIRGSAGRAEMCVGGSCPGRPDGLFATGHDDTLVLRNETGETPIGTGETYHTKCNTCAPNKVSEGPEAYAAVGGGEEFDFEEVVGDPGFVALNERDESGNLIGGGPTLAFGSSTGGAVRNIAINYGGPVPAGFAGQQFFADVSGEINLSGPTFVNLTSSLFDQRGTAVTRDFISDGGLFMWRWTGGTVLFEGGQQSDLTGNQSIHYIVGTDPGTIPTSNIVATYNFSSGTPSTSADGSLIGAGITDGALQVNFGRQVAQLDMTVVHNVTYDVNGSFLFSSSGSFGGTALAFTTDAGSSCSSNGCGVDISGMFSTPGAVVPQQAGLAYTIGEQNYGGFVHGVGGFTVDPSSIVP